MIVALAVNLIVPWIIKVEAVRLLIVSISNAAATAAWLSLVTLTTAVIAGSEATTLIGSLCVTVATSDSPNVPVTSAVTLLVTVGELADADAEADGNAKVSDDVIESDLADDDTDAACSVTLSVDTVDTTIDPADAMADVA